MIPKLDTYVQETLKSYIEKILYTIDQPNESYIINSAIGRTSDEDSKQACEDFKSLYRENHNFITYSYVYPPQKEDVTAMYVIMRGPAQETDDYLGNIVGVHDYGLPANDEDYVTESVPLKKDDFGYFLELSHPIIEFYALSDFTSNFVDKSKGDADPNRVNMVDAIAPYLGQPIEITYKVADTGSLKDTGGTDFGFNKREQVVVQAISSNINTVRTLDSLLSYTTILMRESPREQRYYQLGHTESKGLNILEGLGSSLDKPVYVIPTILTYDSTYSVSKNTAQRIDEILFKRE